MNLFLKLFLASFCTGFASALEWYQCPGCGRNSPQASRGCDWNYDLAPLDGGPVQVTGVAPGEAFDIDVAGLLADVPDDFFRSDDAHSFDWRSTGGGALYHTLGILRPTRSLVLEEPVENLMIYQEIAHGDLDDGVLHSRVPAIPYDEGNGGPETVLQLSVNVDPGSLSGTFTVNYFSLEAENRMFFCARIDVDADADSWMQSDEYRWEVSPWSACRANIPCPYGDGTQGIKERSVRCSHPAVVPAVDQFLFSGEDVDIPEDRCGGEPKPESTMECVAPSCGGGLWSTWAAGIEDGDSVMLPEGMSGPVLLDVDTPALNMLDVRSPLRVLDGANVTLTADSVMIGNGGELLVGSQTAPFQGEFEVVLTAKWNPVLSRSVEHGVYGPGSKTKSLQGLQGSIISLHGQPVQSWSRLLVSAFAGEEDIVMAAADVTGWKVGDVIVVLNSDFYDLMGPDEDMNERRVIRSIEEVGDGMDPARVRIGLDEPLKTSHYGGDGPELIGTVDGGGGRSVDIRSEVALISRNVRIKGADPVMEGIDPAFGGHVAMLPGATSMALEYVEIGPNMGQAGRLGRYPLHFHHMKRVGPETYALGCSIHSTFQRSITIHDTQGLHVSDTVSYLVRGHAIFFEDGTEIENVIRGNLVVATLPQRIQDLREDHHDDLPSAFWITNFNNEIDNNVAAGTENGVGYWAKLVSHSEGQLLSHPQAVASGIGSFNDNVAHSNQFSGLWIWHDWLPCASEMRTYMYAKDGPTQFTIFGSTSGGLRMDSGVETETGEPVGVFDIVPPSPDFAGGCAQSPVQTLERFVSYKHRDVGTAVYLSSTNIAWKNFTSISDTTAMAFAQMYRDSAGDDGLSVVDSQLIDGLMVATSASHGNVLNRDKWCAEMEAKGVPGVSSVGCVVGECHPWPDTSHPSGFPDEYVLTTSSERYLSGVSLANEGTVGAQVVSNLQLVDFDPNPACGVLDTMGVHVKPGIGLEFPVGGRRVDSATVIQGGRDVTATTNVARIVRLFAEDNNGNHETVLLGPAALGSSAPAFPKGAVAVVPAWYDDLFFEENGCIDERIDDPDEWKIDAVLCDLRQLWLTSWSVDFSKTPLMTSGDGPGELACTPSLLPLEFEEYGEPERTYSAVGYGEEGETGIGRPSESDDYYEYRYPFKSAVGKMYLLSLDIDNEECAELYTDRTETNEGVFITMEKMDYDPSTMPSRAFDLVLEIPAYFGRPIVESYLDKTGGDYGRLSAGIVAPYVSLPSKENLDYVSEGTTNDQICCDGMYYVHVRLGERVGGVDTALRLTWKDDTDEDFECNTTCPPGSWPFASGFEDTSRIMAQQRYGS